jgi:hypothetical protein
LASPKPPNAGYQTILITELPEQTLVVACKYIGTQPLTNGITKRLN